MEQLSFQIVTRWVTLRGGEFLQTIAFATREEARREACRLCAQLGLLESGKMLKSIELSGGAPAPPDDDETRPDQPPTVDETAA